MLMAVVYLYESETDRLKCTQQRYFFTKTTNSDNL